MRISDWSSDVCSSDLARKPSSGADSFIKRVAGGGPAKAFAVARAESLDRLLVQKRFGDRQQGETFDPAGGALICRIERPDAFDLVPEEVEPQRVLDRKSTRLNSSH